MHRGTRFASVLIVLATAFLVGLGGADLASGQGPACQTTRDKSAAPASVVLGETVTVTLKVGGACPEIEKKADVVLVIDRSGSMAGRAMGSVTKLDAAKDAAAQFVDAVDVSLVQLGVIAFDAVPVVVSGFSVDKVAVRRAIDGIQVRTGGSGTAGTNIVDALARAHSLVTGPGARADATPVIIFLTDGMHTVPQPPIQDIDPVIASLRSDGVVAYSIGLGSDAERWLLRRIADRESRYFHSPTSDELTGVYLEIAWRIQATVLFDAMTISDVVPANMTYIPSSAVPPAFYDAAGRTLNWTLYDVPNAGAEVTYRLRPQEVGTHPTNVVATGDYTDGLGEVGQITFPVPFVTVTALSGCVCRITQRNVPAWVIEAAQADPERVYGWNLLLDEGKPGAPPYPTPGHDRPPNPRRTCLDLQNRNVPWHPLFNSVVWRAGCLVGPAGP